jgi:hypothetical protein
MTSSKHTPFYLHETGGTVGTFEEEPPLLPGDYRYMPFRSASHYKFGVLLHAGNTVKCYYDAEDRRIIFQVAAVPAYGHITVTHVDDSH